MSILLAAGILIGPRHRHRRLLFVLIFCVSCVVCRVVFFQNPPRVLVGITLILINRSRGGVPFWMSATPPITARSKQRRIVPPRVCGEWRLAIDDLSSISFLARTDGRTNIRTSGVHGSKRCCRFSPLLGALQHVLVNIACA